jgi:hypothetical protein
MRVVLTGWRPGLQKISLSLLVRESAGYDLAAAKSVVEQLMEKPPVTVPLASREAAAEFLRQATNLGAECHLDEDGGGHPQRE